MTSADPAVTAWSPLQRVAFRFAFVYFILYNIPAPLSELPGLGFVGVPFERAWSALTELFARRALHLPLKASEATGSGDSLFSYVQHLVNLLVSVVITAVWSLAARERRAYPRLHEGLRVYLRLVLALIMFGYGFVKIFKSQFPAPSDAQLLKTYGDSSPMNLLWTFMGYSTPYTIFAGVMEVVPAALLLARRTTTLGALLLLVVLSNVVLLNLCYDVPVKLYSAHLWLMALFLVLPEAPRLWRAVVLGRAVPARTPPPPLARGRLRGVGHALYLLLALVVTGKTARDAWTGYRSYGDGAAASPLHGAYDVEEMTLAGQTLPPLLTDKRRLRRVAISKRGVTFFPMEGPREALRSTKEITDAAGPIQLDLSTWSDASHRRRGLLELTKLPGEGAAPLRLLLQGQWEGAPLRLRLVRVDARGSLLMSRGFHFVNEVPFNR